MGKIPRRLRGRRHWTWEQKGIMGDSIGRLFPDRADVRPRRCGRRRSTAQQSGPNC